MASCMQVLVVPLPSAESHTFVMVKVVQEMAARGHQVLVRMPSCPIVLSMQVMDLLSYPMLCRTPWGLWCLRAARAPDAQQRVLRAVTPVIWGASMCTFRISSGRVADWTSCDGSPAACCMVSRSALWCLQMVIPESDLSTLEKVDASAFNVTTYKAAYTKQVRRSAYQPCKSASGTHLITAHMMSRQDSFA